MGAGIVIAKNMIPVVMLVTIALGLIVPPTTYTIDEEYSKAKAYITIANEAIKALEGKGYSVASEAELYNKAVKALNEGRYDEAVNLCKKIIKAIRDKLMRILEQTKINVDQLSKLIALKRFIERSKVPDHIKEAILSKINEALGKKNYKIVSNEIIKYMRMICEYRKQKVMERFMEKHREIMGGRPIPYKLIKVMELHKLARFMKGFDYTTSVIKSFIPSSIKPLILLIKAEECVEKAEELIKEMSDGVKRSKLINATNKIKSAINLSYRAFDEFRKLNITSVRDITSRVMTFLKEAKALIMDVEAMENVTRMDLYITGLLKRAIVYVTIFIKSIEIPEKVLVFGVITWIADDKEFIMIGFYIPPIWISKHAKTIWPSRPHIPPIIAVWYIDARNATVIGEIKIGYPALVYGSLEGVVDGTLKVIADKVITFNKPVLPSTVKSFMKSIIKR